MVGIIRKLPLDKATTPREGSVIVNRWWVVDDEGLYWFSMTEDSKGASPQCNASEAITADLRNQLYPGARIEFIPVVFVGLWDEYYGYNPFKGLG